MSMLVLGSFPSGPHQGQDMEMWQNDADQCRKRKREWRSSSSVGGGDADSHHHHHETVAGTLQEPVHTRDPWIDLTASRAPLPPGWEQCLDLQTGEMYFINRATQAKSLHDPRKPHQMNMAAYPYNQGSEPVQPTGTFHYQSSVTMDNPGLLTPSLQQSSDVCILNSSMTTTICHHCYTFVMISQSSPQCPNCKTACSTGLSLAAPMK